MSQPGMWSHRCSEEGCEMEVGVGEPCSWCGGTEPAVSCQPPAWNQHAPSVNLVDCDIDTGEAMRHPQR